MNNKYTKEILDFLNENTNADPVKIILKKSPFTHVYSKELATQIKGRQIAKQKFPFLLAYEHYRYPESISLEQSSSEITAAYKANMFTGETVVDLTAGMGVDSYFLSKNFKKLDYVDSNSELCTISRYNFDILNVSNAAVHHTTAEDYLEGRQSRFDLVYVDPSRRVKGNKKTSVINLVPNVVALQNQLKEMGKEVLIKLSSMQDITETINLLTHVKRVEIVALGNEVKELLVLLDTTHDLPPIIKAVELNKDKNPLIFQSSMENLHHPIAIGPVQDYLYQPHPVLVKAGLHDFHASELSLTKIHNNSQFYTSTVLQQDYFGRTFSVIARPSFKRKEVLKHIADQKANIICKNYPLSPAEVAKKLGLKDGGNHYLIASTLYDNSKSIFVCERL